jgi:aspartate kinase
MVKTFVFKFGGASIKDANSIKKLSENFRNRLQNHTVVVISAMGKTTNALEELLELKLKGKSFSQNNTILKNLHLEVCQNLFEEGHSVFATVENLFLQLGRLLDLPLNKENYDERYDQVVSYGELLSSRIVQEYLCTQGLLCIWQDARELIVTHSQYRAATVQWEQTKLNCKKYLTPKLQHYPVVTQGFIGRDSIGNTTTLGREGSDFSAAIIAWALEATSVTIWKDVPGVLNADPKRFADTVLFEELDYREAAELTYYGASVIHPKTIKPLAEKDIPLFVRSFLEPSGSGTKIHATGKTSAVPCIVVKDLQVLISFQVTDFTFVNEAHLHRIYGQLEVLNLKVNLLQVSATSISIVVDNQLFKLERLLANLKDEFSIRYNDALQLITVKNYKKELIDELLSDKSPLLEQVTRTTFQVVHQP